MPVTRSAALGRTVLTAGQWHTLASVPQNEIYLVKSAYVTAAGGGGDVLLALTAANSSVAVTLKRWTLAAGQNDTWQGWIVAEPGDTLQANAAVAGVTIWVSGAALPGVYEPQYVSPLPALKGRVSYR